MPDTNTNQKFRRSIRHRGRITQIPIYLGKLLRGFVYLSDWKMLPMAAIIAALVSIVVREGMFITMETTQIGALALTCVAIWNGCFNSIQVICRERSVVKREHRSGMHISSYIVSHMLYQALLCFAQTVLSIYVYKFMGLKFPAEGLVSRWMTMDIGVTLFLVTYAADMLSLFISAIARNTTAAMTVMPFVLILQLVFSGTMFALPERLSIVPKFTISNYGLRSIIMQADYNSLELSSGWSILNRLGDQTIPVHTTVGELADIMSQSENPLVDGLRRVDLTQILEGDTTTLTEIIPVKRAVAAEEETPENTETEPAETATDAETEPVEPKTLTDIYLGDLMDLMAQSDWVKENADLPLDYTVRVQDLIDLAGEDRVRDLVIEKTTEASYNAAYEQSRANILKNWAVLALLSLGFAAAATVVLEFIDKDKR